ncbi:hypothetical protein EYF80_052917 [Liparis tanakae]|uniref:Uncharacterized protein n=1 Tax=Liparis tanakae TaxID=230148 RepID=A0A4Z2F6X0_9TELE|nr:hypothetical protein EYF80_052917 [Liparis tanakae]
MAGASLQPWGEEEEEEEEEEEGGGAVQGQVIGIRVVATNFRISGNIWPDCQIGMKLGGRVEQGNLMRQMVCKREPSGEPSLEEKF